MSAYTHTRRHTYTHTAALCQSSLGLVGWCSALSASDNCARPIQFGLQVSGGGGGLVLLCVSVSVCGRFAGLEKVN